MKFKFWNLFILGFGFFGVSVLWPLYNSYVPIFLKNFDLSSFAVGSIMTIDNIFAIFMLPVIGALSDQTRTRFGRRMPYIMIGSPLAAIMFVLIPFLKDFNSLWLLMTVIIFMNFFMALFRSPVVALMPDITPSKYRSQANGIINFMGGLGALLAYFAGKPLYDANPVYPFIAGAALMLIGNIVLFVFVKEPKEYTISEGHVSVGSVFRKGSSDLIKNLKDVFLAKEKSLLFILLSILFWFIGFNAIETFFTTYVKYHVGIAESTGAFILGIFSLTFMIFSIPAGIIGSKMGRKKTIFSGIIIVFLMAVAIFYFGNTDMNIQSNKDFFIKIMYIIFPIGGIGWALINVNSLPMVVDMTTTEKSGGYTGLYYFFSMAANIFAPPLAGFFMDKKGYNALLVFSVVFFLLAFFTMMFVRKGEAKE
ncbi:MAG TPA: SLC45 family MFS transporter [Tepiditoga sp.]|nr:SLC45 family MFS transporter [Thermotogota bacterium]HOO73874.1 SLC45 family MFS transporter [Tepiditoga sp.]